MNERDYIYETNIEVSELNENNLLKPYGYQNLFAQIAEKHLNKIGLNVDTTTKYNLAWVLRSLSIEIVKPVEGCVKLFANTWYSHRKGPFFRREFVFKNEDNELIFRGSSFSVLLDLESRSVYRKMNVPFLNDDPIEIFEIDAAPSFKTDQEFFKTDERKVYNSYIDCLGHVNNTRYGEFAYDALSVDEKSRLKELKRMDIFFLSELRTEDTFSVLKAYEVNYIYIRGLNDTKNTNSFDVVFTF